MDEREQVLDDLRPQFRQPFHFKVRKNILQCKISSFHFHICFFSDISTQHCLVDGTAASFMRIPGYLKVMFSNENCNMCTLPLYLDYDNTKYEKA